MANLISRGAQSSRATSTEVAVDLSDLFRREHERLVRRCTAMLGNAHDAEEVVQEAFIRLSKRGPLEGEPAAYLNVIVRRLCWEHRRRLRPMTSIEGMEVESGLEDTVLDRDRLGRAWRRLSLADRRLLFGSYAGYTLEELSSLTGQTASAVGVGLYRARQRARRFADGVIALLPILRTRFRLWRTTRADDATRIGGALQIAAVRWLAVALVGLAVAGSTLVPAKSTTRTPGIEGGWLSPYMPSPHAQPKALESTALGAVPFATRRPRRAGDPLSRLLHPAADAQPEDATIQSLTVSPGYAQDRTVFASADLVNGCGTTFCPVLFVSRDGAATWSVLTTSNSFQGGRILLPPNYPVDPTIFVNGPAGLQRSIDGGQTFSTASALPAVAAVDPSSPPMDAQIVIASQALMRYRSSTGATLPEPVTDTNVAGADDELFAPGTAALLVASCLPSQTGPGQWDGQVASCPAIGQCRDVFDAPQSGPLNLLGWTAQGVGMVLVSSGRHVWAAPSGSLAFAPVPLPRDDPITSLVAETGLSRLIVAMSSPADPWNPVIASSTDLGRTWEVGGKNLEGTGPVTSLTYLPNGMLLGAVSAGREAGTFGLMCSVDDGASWRQRC